MPLAFHLALTSLQQSILNFRKNKVAEIVVTTPHPAISNDDALGVGTIGVTYSHKIGT
jgi:hypothetical protein